MSTADALLFGRRTWQTMAAAWPERASDPYADQMNAIKKYVVSRTLSQHDLTWNNTALLSSEDPIAEIATFALTRGRRPIDLGQRQSRQDAGRGRTGR